MFKFVLKVEIDNLIEQIKSSFYFRFLEKFMIFFFFETIFEIE